jgi:50S ribosomal subunit-associated GTPase HflX
MNLEDVKTLRLLLAQLDERADEVGDDVVAGAEILLELNLAKADLGMVYNRVSGVVADLMGSDPILNLRDGATVECRQASARKTWQHKELAEAVIDRIVDSSVDMRTGEVVRSPKEMALEMLNYLAPSYWRVGKLNDIGLNADLYCETSDPKTSVIIRKGDAR